MRFDHVPARTVRFWALLDTSVIALAIPPTATAFIDVLYWVNGLLGYADAAAPFGAMQMFFVNLSGVLVAVWAAARLLHPVGVLAWVDAWGRLAVCLLIAWFVLVESAPPVLWFFVLTEGAGTVAQLRACHRRN